jgi:hypothetical protein
MSGTYRATRTGSSSSEYALAEQLVLRAPGDLTEAVRRKELDASADTDEAFLSLGWRGRGQRMPW